MFTMNQVLDMAHILATDILSLEIEETTTDTSFAETILLDIQASIDDDWGEDDFDSDDYVFDDDDDDLDDDDDDLEDDNDDWDEDDWDEDDEEW